jgi:hypothetical protein
MKKQLVAYSCNIDVKDEFISKNGRIKLADVAQIVSDCALKVVANMPHEFELAARVEEAIMAYGVDTDDGSYVKGIRTCARVTVERLMPAFPHVREKILENGVDEYINNLPKTPFEDVVFEFYKLLGHEIYRDPIWSSDLKIKLVHKDYYEYLELMISDDFDIQPIRNMRDYQKFLKEQEG